MREPIWKSYMITTAEPVLNSQQCDELIRIGESEPKINASIGAGIKNERVNNNYRKSNISWIPFPKAIPIYQVIGQWMETTNNNFFGFDNVQIAEQGQFSTYFKGGFYDWHMDSNVTMSSMPNVRKISMSLLLNDPKEFEGGDLDIFCGDSLDSKGNKITLQRGCAVFFASFLLHRVNTVTKGTRKTLVMWFSGTPLR